jgi:hypothetical protein
VVLTAVLWPVMLCIYGIRELSSAYCLTSSFTMKTEVIGPSETLYCLYVTTQKTIFFAYRLVCIILETVYLILEHS